ADVCYAGSFIDRQKLDSRHSGALHFLKNQHAAACVLDQVGPGLGDNDRELSPLCLVKANARAQVHGEAPGLADLRRIVNGNHERGIERSGHFPLVIVTRVPSPARESIVNSLTSRFAPPSPIPMPLPVVKPSVSARSTSGMPGP